jgi:hypothetical protein
MSNANDLRYSAEYVATLLAEIERLGHALADMERERDSARHERDVLVVTEEAHRALSDKAQAYFAALAALVEHLQPGRSLTDMARWDAPWPQVAEALRR